MTPRSGVKWKVQRGCRSSQARTLGCLWLAPRRRLAAPEDSSVVEDAVDELAGRHGGSTVLRKRMNS